MEQDGELEENNEEKEFLQGFTSIPYGLQLIREYIHPSKHCDFQDVIHNTKTYDYIILDSRGISSWHVNATNSSVKRMMEFDAYKFNTLRSLIYSRFYNVYFALTKEFDIRVYNLNFHEVCFKESDGDSVSKLLYSNKKNELITVCRNKLKFLKYCILERNSSFQGITLLREIKIAESLLLSNAECDDELGRVYLLSDSSIYCYSFEGRCLFHLKGNSFAYFCVCVFSKEANLMIAGSINGELSIYSPTGGLVTTLLSHSRIVTAVVVHPNDGNLFLSASLDGTIKLFSLQMLEEIYSINAYSEGILFMRVHTKNLLYAASRKGVQLYNLNYSFKFWSTTRCPVERMNITQHVTGIRQYVVVSTTDFSIRLYSKKTGQRRSTILPPPEIAIGQNVISVAFDRGGRAMYILFNPQQIWIYSTRTDPATRVATWNLESIIKDSQTHHQRLPNDEEDEDKRFGASSISKRQAEENVTCCSLLTVRRSSLNAEEPENDFLNFGFLLCGLSNGAVLVLDPCKRGSLFKSFKAHSTSPVVDMAVDYRAEETHLLTRLNTINGTMIRIWDVVSLHCFYRLRLEDNFTRFCYKNFQLVVGYTTGYIRNEFIGNDIDCNSTRSSSSTTLTLQSKMKDHDGAVLSVDIFEKDNAICSCGNDNFVRIWNKQKVLLTEIRYDSSLKYAVFLNNFGSVLISFKSQLFIIPRYVVFSGHHQDQGDDRSSGDESIIYEDPLVRREGYASRQRTSILTTLASYLVPYPNLGLESLWMKQGVIGEESDCEQSDEENVSISSKSSQDSFESFASTAIYQDSSEGSVCDDHDMIQFPRCDGSPEPPTAIIQQDNDNDDDDGTSVDSEPIEKPKEELIQPTPAATPKELLPVSNESLYDKLRKKTLSTTRKHLPSTKSSKPRSTATNVVKMKRPDRPKKMKKNLKTRKTPQKKQPLKQQQQQLPRKDKPVVNIDVSPTDVEEIVDEAPPKQLLPATTLDLLNDDNLQTKPVIPVISAKNVDKELVTKKELEYPFSVHHRTLSLMAAGKGERAISSSYQNVMQSLMNPTSPAPSTTGDIELNDLEDDEDHTIVELEGLLSPKYDADYVDHSTLDIRGRLKEQHAVRTLSPKPTSPKLIRESDHIKQKNLKHLLPTTETSVSTSNNGQQEKVITTSSKTATVRFLESCIPEKDKLYNLEEQKRDCSSSIEEDECIPSSVHMNKNESVQEAGPVSSNSQSSSHTSRSRRTSIQHSPKQVSTTIDHKETTKRLVSASQRSFHTAATTVRSPSEKDVTAVILNLSTKLKEKQRKESQSQQTRERKRSAIVTAATTEPTIITTKTRNETTGGDVAVISIEIRKSMSSLTLKNSNTVDDTDEEAKKIRNAYVNKSTDANNNIAPRGRKISNTIILPFDESRIVEGHQLLPQSIEQPHHEASSRSVHSNLQRQSPVDEYNSNISADDGPEQSHNVVKFILSSFKNPMSPPKKDRVQFKLSEGEEQVTVHPSGSHCTSIEMNPSLSRPCSVDHHSRISFRSDDSRNANDVFITPRNSCISINDDDYRPVSNVTVRQPSSVELLTSDESAVVISSSSLLDRLHRHRASRQKQRERHESAQAKRNSSSGYDTTSRDTFFESQNSFRSTSASPSKQRLSIKRGPLSVEEISPSNKNSPSLDRNSEGIYFDEYLPVAHPISKSQQQKCSPHLNKTQKHIKIRNLEKKLSGQQHRCFAPKTEHQIEADRITLLMLQKKSVGIKIPMKRSSSSIPNRCQFKLMENLSN